MCGSPFEVTAVKNDEIRVAPMNGGALSHLKFKALAELMASEKILVTYLPRDVSANGNESLRGLTDAQWACLNRQLHYVRNMVTRCPTNPRSQQAIKELRLSIASEINDQDPPGVSTIAKWVKSWMDGGREDSALAPKIRKVRDDTIYIHKDVLEIVQSSISSIYLNKHRNPAKAVIADVAMRVANYNAQSPHPLPAPSPHVIRRLIQKIDAYERDVKRHGKAYARRRHRATGRSLVPSEPLEMCMADGQLVDIMIVEDPMDGGPLRVVGRAYLTIILDVRTRCILSAFVSLQPFSGGTVLKAMQEAVVASPGRPRGIMSTLIVDNGCDYQDSGFIAFLARMGTTLEICGPRSPNGKAHVERFFRTISEDLIHKLPGTTFSNPDQRGEYRSQDMARLTIAELRSHVQTWIDEVYHQRPHRALGRAPIDVWNEETA